MCILCDHGMLDRLTVRLERLGPGELADAIRTAREAAGPGVMDQAEAVLRDESSPLVAAELFGEVVVARALEAGVVSSTEAYRWDEELRSAEALQDPRVQAFLSSSAEIIGEYLLLHDERRAILTRFLEARGEDVEFAWLGRDGELWFDHRGELYCVISEEEALEIVERDLAGKLHTLPAELLLRYTRLPETGAEVLEGILARPPETADPLLAGLVDLSALADDRVRAGGFGPFLETEEAPSVEDMRFGEWVVARVREE